MYIESIYHMPSLNRLHRHNQMSVLRLRSQDRTVLIVLNNSIYPGVYNELREEEIEQNRTWRLRDILSKAKVRLSVVFDENAFDEVTFRQTGNSTKTFDEVS